MVAKQKFEHLVKDFPELIEDVKSHIQKVLKV